MSPSINSTRRFYLLKRFASEGSGDEIEQVWRAKQEAIPGSPLPSSFPLRERLSSVGYSTFEDLTGADTRELRRRGFARDEAEAVIAALPTTS